ncbi:MAG: TMEM175 family protein [Caldimonas sp.]
MSAAAHDEGFLPLHRVEALTDGIFAVAMTLLVIELKLPEHGSAASAEALGTALVALVPKAISWALSFFVLAMFWVGHHRVFAYVKRADATLVVLNLIELAAVSLMPFASALSGEFSSVYVAHVIFSINMAVLAVTALAVLRYVYRHPELGSPMPHGRYAGARLRILGVAGISVLAALIGGVLPYPAMGNMAFMLMAVISPMSHRLERRACGPAHAPAAGARPT